MTFRASPDFESQCAEYKDELLANVSAMAALCRPVERDLWPAPAVDRRREHRGERQRWLQTLHGTRGLGDFCGSAILITEISYSDTMDAGYGLARYASICQSSGPAPIVEPGIRFDGERDIDEFLETFEETWAAAFKGLR